MKIELEVWEIDAIIACVKVMVRKQICCCVPIDNKIQPISFEDLNDLSKKLRDYLTAFKPSKPIPEKLEVQQESERQHNQIWTAWDSQLEEMGTKINEIIDYLEVK